MSKTTKIISTISFFLSLATIAVSLIPFFNIFGLIFGVTALVLSVIAKIKVKKENIKSKMANVSLILSIIGTVICLISTLIYAIIFAKEIANFITSGFIEDFLYSLLKVI